MPQRAAISKAVIALSVTSLVLATALGVSLSVSSQSTPRTITETSTRTLTQIRVETSTVNETLTTTVTPAQIVNQSFYEHLISFSTGNLSAIVSQYEPNANVTWQQASCFSGLYSGTHIITQLLNATRPWPIQNATVSSIATLPNDSVSVNSTFSLAVKNFNAMVSAQDTYSYSSPSNTWLISQETWHFLIINSEPFFCVQ
jgi:hypothetical protein